MLRFYIVVIIAGVLTVSTGGSSIYTPLRVVEALSNNIEETKNPCPCSNELLCMPLAEAKRRNSSAPHVLRFIKKSKQKEVFAFVLKCDPSVWGRFNWTKLSTIALAGFYDRDLLCHAHQHGVKVVKTANFPTSQLRNVTARRNWVKFQASDATLKFMDGINIDYEDALDPLTPEQYGLTSLVKETAEAFHSTISGSQVSVDVAWSANGIDGRYYEYKKIANYSDLIFIMAYDEQSQILSGPCTARPNSGIYQTARGLLTYLKLGIPTSKMILGVPWYGYNYPCLELAENNTCFIEEIPFRGVNCSDAAGTEYAYSYMIKTRQLHNATYHWDAYSLSPWYNYKDDSGQDHQMRYDDESSLMYKYTLAITMGLRGVGMWTANFLDYTDDTPDGIYRRELMWSLLP